MSCFAVCDDALICCAGKRLLRLLRNSSSSSSDFSLSVEEIPLPEECRRVSASPSGRRAACLLAESGRVCLVRPDGGDGGGDGGDGRGGRCEVLDVVGRGGAAWIGGVAEFAGENRLLVGDRDGVVTLFLFQVFVGSRQN